jgi:hypothetical protein
MPDVTSTTMSHVAYDASARALTITFVSGRRYRYAGVPPSEYEALLAAESKGSFFNARIRDRYGFEPILE